MNTHDAHFCTECGSPLAAHQAPYPRLEHEGGSFTPVRPMTPEERVAASATPAPQTPAPVRDIPSAPTRPQLERPSPPSAPRAAAPEPQLVRAAPASRTRSAASAGARRSQSRFVLVVTATAFLAAAAGVGGAWLLLNRNKPATTITAPATSATSTATASPSSAKPSTSPSSASPSTPRPTGPPQEDEVATFVKEYFEGAPSDPASSWDMLTGQAQGQSGDEAAYSQWWGTVESSSAKLLDWDQTNQVAKVALDLEMKTGKSQQSTVSLPIDRAANGKLLIVSLNG